MFRRPYYIIGKHVLRKMKNELVSDIYETLLGMIGHLHWWPADTPFEVVIGTILTQSWCSAVLSKAIVGKVRVSPWLACIRKKSG